MKKLQFSLSGIFALTVIAGVLLAFAERFASEAFLQAIWLTTFLLSYWRFPQRGWSKVLRVTLITGAVWTVCILGTHLMYANVPGPRGLALRAVFLTAIGVVAAFLLACVVTGSIAVVRRWLGATTRGRILSIAALLIVTVSGWSVWSTTRTRYWEPRVAASDDMPSLESDTVQQIRERHGVEQNRIVASPDASFMAAIKNGKISVFDSVTGNLATEFEPAKDEWFSSIAFLSDNTSLAAVHHSKSGDWKLSQWDTTDWTSRDPVPLADLLGTSRPGKSYPILVDRLLLIVYVDDRQPTAAQVELKTVDLVDESWTPKEFASMTVEQTAKATYIFEREWTLSPNGQWITSGRLETQLVLGRGATEPLRVNGTLLGFLPDGDRLVLSESGSRFVWQVYPRSPVVEPPFWNHLQHDKHFRVSILDCPTNRVVQRSRWWRSSIKKLSFDGTQLVLNRDDSVLIWEAPRFDELGRQP